MRQVNILREKIVGYVEKRLDKKLWLISKFMTPQTGQQIIKIHILSNISRSTGNRAIKYGLLIKFSLRNIFLQMSCRK